MNRLLITILLFGLVPLGAGLLVMAFRILPRKVNGNVVIETLLTSKNTDFELVQTGTYAIWQKGQLFRLAPVSQFVPVVVHLPTGHRLTLRRSLFGTTLNDGVMARGELVSFWAEAGLYRLCFAQGSSISKLERWLFKPFRVLFKPVDTTQYVIQVRESQPGYYTFVSFLLLLLLGGLCIIGGIISGSLSMQLR